MTEESATLCWKGLRVELGFWIGGAFAGLNESAVVALMRAHMKGSSFRMWRKRMKGRVTKHAALRPESMNDGGPHIARHRIPQR